MHHAVQLVDAVQHVVLHSHANIVLGGLWEARCSVWKLNLRAANHSHVRQDTHISVAQIQYEHVPAESGLSASAPSVTSAFGPLQRQRQRRVGLQILQVLRRTQLHVAVAGELHWDGDLEQKGLKNKVARHCSLRQTD